MTVAEIRPRTVCPLCRVGRCGECSRPLRCACEFSHKRPKSVKPDAQPRSSRDDVMGTGGWL